MSHVPKRSAGERCSAPGEVSLCVGSRVEAAGPPPPFVALAPLNLQVPTAFYLQVLPLPWTLGSRLVEGADPGVEGRQ